MKQRLWCLALIVGLISGCASHYYTIENKVVYVYLKAPQAGEVSYATSADGFQLHPITPDVGGKVYFQASAQSEFKYFYMVDGEVYLPACKYKETDDFGGENCIYMPENNTGQSPSLGESS